MLNKLSAIQILEMDENTAERQANEKTLEVAMQFHSNRATELNKTHDKLWQALLIQFGLSADNGEVYTLKSVNGIACDYSYRDKNGSEIVETNWIPVTSFGKVAELLGEYAHKGNRVYVNGRFKTDRWEDGEGVTRYFTKIYMKDFIVLDPKKAGGNLFPQQVQQNNNDFDDDIPF